MSIEFASPPLLAATKKINGAQSEMGRLDEFLALKPFDTEVAPLRWAAITTVATALHNIYNGMEDVMKVVCRDVDGFVPGGGSSHQDILDQVASPRKGIRPALVSEEWYPDVNELRAFRHVVNHNYANELREDLVTANLERMRDVFPKFLEALQELDDFLSSPAPSALDPFEK